MKEFYIGNRKIGGDASCFIIAELSANHGGKIDIAIESIREAKKTGADAIKLQTFTPDTITIDSKKPEFLINHGTMWDGRYLYDLYQETYLPREWHKRLFEVAEEEGLICFSSPFDLTAVDFLEELQTPAYKIASPEILDIPLIEKCAKTGKPIIISTGIASISDIELAVNTCRNVGNQNIILLKCTTSYPAPIEDANLKTLNSLAETFGVIPGLSDHTLGTVVPTVSVALGAKVIEKHFIMDKSIGGADAAFSLDVNEFTEMVASVRNAEKAIGEVSYNIGGKASNLSKLASRSLFIVKDVEKGEILTEDNVKSIRPGNGIHPKYYNEILGKKATQNIEKGTPMSWQYIK
ncbi:pseudaminic acid synthase [Aquimarina sp. MMG015]|uniref:pseudaminic acid synthase n=1 Tax=Aquimarina sp. MMG015 TaxID=2822689 RepID=UPI001B3A6E4B|nr:pseudaminic acid synthase [Aquimarina sp. MMG015]MBQ4801415.1 pseudaminic acid synthase [Aquimarina sp. MMG015]